jgi:hypothetical protein
MAVSIGVPLLTLAVFSPATPLQLEVVQKVEPPRVSQQSSTAGQASSGTRR